MNDVYVVVVGKTELMMQEDMLLYPKYVEISLQVHEGFKPWRKNVDEEGWTMVWLPVQYRLVAGEDAYLLYYARRGHDIPYDRAQNAPIIDMRPTPERMREYALFKWVWKRHMQFVNEVERTVNQLLQVIVHGRL